jgi:Threonine dehydratase
MIRTWKHLRAVSLAIVLQNIKAFRGKRVGVVQPGGNVDPDRLPWLA